MGVERKNAIKITATSAKSEKLRRTFFCAKLQIKVIM
jgi:hypothetical protein